MSQIEKAQDDCGGFVFLRGGGLTGEAIREAIKNGKIEIDPYDPENINPNSYNLRIGNQIATIANNVFETVRCVPCPNPDGSIDAVLVDKKVGHIESDLKKPVEYNTREIPEDGMMLYPNELYLVPTVERIHTDYYEPIITGRSSMGRLGIAVHQEAGFGDIGFDGNMTLQLKVTYPTIIYPYFLMAQVYFLTPHGPIKDLYYGKYQGAKGIAGSKAYLDFQKESK